MADTRAEKGNLDKPRRKVGWLLSTGLAALISLGGVIGIPGCEEREIENIKFQQPLETIETGPYNIKGDIYKVNTKKGKRYMLLDSTTKLIGYNKNTGLIKVFCLGLKPNVYECKPEEYNVEFYKTIEELQKGIRPGPVFFQ